MGEPTQHREKIEELSLLFEISQLLDQSMDLQQVIHPVLRAIADHLGILRGAITLLNRNTKEIQIEAAYGLSSTERSRGRYKLGEGITGKVIQTGKAKVIPRISQEPNFLNRTRARRSLPDISFLCVPVKIGNETIGALSVDTSYEDTYLLQEDRRILSIITSMIAQAVKIRQNIIEERNELLAENTRLHHELEKRFRPSKIIGNSQAMQHVFDMVAQVSHSDTTVLIRGESGTGKELIANAIHYNSTRTNKPFIKVNCAALPESIIESELFGHEKGAFTGALTPRKGRFELANGGTIFLDEIADLSQTTQIKLLRVLQEQEFERVGGNKTIRVSVRIIAATNRNLEEEIVSRIFREDLYYRLNVFPIHLPPLRKRRNDIPLLSDYFTEKYGENNHKTIHRISTPCIDLLMNYHWPGNVRELENCIERAVLLSVDGVIHAHHLPPSLQSAASTNTQIHGTLQESIDRLEKELIIDALKFSKGNMAKASRMLGITERVMGLRVKKYGIKNPKYYL